MRYLIFILPVLLASCVTRERCMEKFPPSVTSTDSVFRSDSVHVVHDTVIIKGETVTVRLNIPCPDLNMEKVFKKNGTTARLIIKNGVVTCEATTDSLTHIIEKLHRTIKEGRTKSRSEVHTKFVKYTPWYYWVLLGMVCAASFWMGRKLSGLIFK